jgi:disulfide bond formation protein DsbB
MAAMVLWVVIAWLVVVLCTSAWVALRGRRLWVAVRSAQQGVQHHVVHARLQELPDRLAELEQHQARLAEVLARLQVSVAEFTVIWRAFGAVAGQARSARSFFTTK